MGIFFIIISLEVAGLKYFLKGNKVKMSPPSVISRPDLKLSKKNKKGDKTRFASIKKKPRKSFEQRRKMKEEQVKCKEMYKQLLQKKEEKKQELRSSRTRTRLKG